MIAVGQLDRTLGIEAEGAVAPGCGPGIEVRIDEARRRSLAVLVAGYRLEGP